MILRSLATSLLASCGVLLATAAVGYESFSVAAFQGTAKFPSRRTSNLLNDGKNIRSTSSRYNHQLHMSSIPEDDDLFSLPDPRKLINLLNGFNITKALPPLPEDKIALGGDVVALFVYTYLDHTTTKMFGEATSMDVSDVVATATSTSTNGDVGPSLPVWFDSTHLNEFSHWLVSAPHSDPYAPAIAASGLAFVSIATCWIICGCFSGAFLNKNTLECTTSKAMEVTGKTWVVMAILMVSLALGSDALWGQLDMIHPTGGAEARGGLTKADMDYIFDSLTVLGWWRFIYNVVLGYR